VEGLEADIYRLCDSAQTRSALKAQLKTPEIEPAIDSLIRSKVLLSLNDKLLAIGINKNGSA
jgi:hypothetical protein